MGSGRGKLHLVTDLIVCAAILIISVILISFFNLNEKISRALPVIGGMNSAPLVLYLPLPIICLIWVYVRARGEIRRKKVEVDGAIKLTLLSERKWWALAEHSEDNILLMEPDGTIAYANRAVGDMDIEKLKGFSIYKLLPIEKRQGLRTAIEKAGAEGKATEFEGTFVTPEGKNITWQNYIEPLKDGDKVTAYILVGRDLAKRTMLEVERTRLATAIEQTVESIIITDADKRILYVNPSFERITGYTRDEAVGNDLSLLRSDKHDEAFYQNLWETVARDNIWRGWVSSRKKDGETYSADVSISPVFNGAGEIINYVSMQNDVTREVELESRLRQAQKLEAIGILAKGIAHDFGNIIYAILGYTDLAMSDLPRGGEIYGNLEEVTKAGKRASGLVDHILTFSQQTRTERKPTRFHPMIKEALNLLRSSFPSNIEIRETINTSCSPVLADPAQIHQMIMNLFTNAQQAMSEKGGTLVVNLDEVEIDYYTASTQAGLEPGKYVCLSVGDTGRGIDESIMQKVFDPYFTTEEKSEGTGLGLATAHGIVKRHYGAITIESEPGMGTRLNVFLPVCKKGFAEEDRDAPSSIAELNRYFGSESILLIDDDESVMKLARTILEKIGYTVTARTSSVEALSAFRANPEGFNLVISEMNMQNMNGLELARQIRIVRPTVPVIFCTGFSDSSSEKQALEMGITEFVRKPVITLELAKAIYRALKK